MKKQLRILAFLGRKLDLSQFYCITMYQTNTILQGLFSTEINDILVKTGLKGEINPSTGFVEYRYKNILIVLTPCLKH